MKRIRDIYWKFNLYAIIYVSLLYIYSYLSIFVSLVQCRQFQHLGEKEEEHLATDTSYVNFFLTNGIFPTQKSNK